MNFYPDPCNDPNPQIVPHTTIGSYLGTLTGSTFLDPPKGLGMRKSLLTRQTLWPRAAPDGQVCASTLRGRHSATHPCPP